jgi:hypothetical protein
VYSVASDTGYTGSFVFTNNGTLYNNTTSSTVAALNYDGNQINANYILNATHNIILPTTMGAVSYVTTSSFMDPNTYGSLLLSVPYPYSPTFYSYSLTLTGDYGTYSYLNRIVFNNTPPPVNSEYKVYVYNNSSSILSINNTGLGVNIKTTFNAPVLMASNSFAIITLNQVLFNEISTTVVSVQSVA